jgi:glycosyltransferase involved in cell wall biosynthesis
VKATEKLNTLSVPIKVVGTGPLEPIAKEATGLNCVGFKDHNEVRQLLGQATYVVAPSICYETFSLAVIEAFSCGTAVIASRHGAFSELIKDGVTGMLFNPGDSDDLASKVSWAEANPHEMLKMGKAARLEYEKKYTPARNYNLLMHIYEDAICGAG